MDFEQATESDVMSASTESIQRIMAGEDLKHWRRFWNELLIAEVRHLNLKPGLAEEIGRHAFLMGCSYARREAHKHSGN